MSKVIDFVKRLLWREEQRRTNVGFIRVTGGPFAMVDAEDLWLSRYQWSVCRGKCRNYVQAYIDGRTRLMHRVIAKTPTGLQTHHADNVTFNNRRRNLQNVTPKAHAILTREAA